MGDDGIHTGFRLDTWLLVPRGLLHTFEAHAASSDDASRAAILREWLPPPSTLLEIAENECTFRCCASGAAHPSLFCARLHGEELGDWEATAEVAAGMLNIEQFNPTVRCEACRLLARARAALGQRDAARESWEAMAVEAVRAKYVWFEMIAVRELLRGSEGGDADGVRARLGAVLQRVAASEEELREVLGPGEWEAVRVAAQ